MLNDDNSALELVTNKDCYMIYHGTKLYIINCDVVGADPQLAKTLAGKIINSDPAIKTLSYNGNNVNYSVDGILVNVKSTNDRHPIRKKDYLIVRETPEMYRVLRSSVNLRTPKWVLNIFNGSAEGEIIYKETADYYIMPDFKWDHNIESPYLLVLFKDVTLQSIRDLTSHHLTMLQRAHRDIMDFIYQRYGHGQDVIRCYFHYQPSAWQLHMHVQHINSKVVASYQSSKAVTYNDVMQNISLSSDYYNKATLECIVSSTDYGKYYKGGGL